jgi:GNAT superfamily N-acetyltransferase
MTWIGAQTYVLRGEKESDEQLLWDLFAADRVPLLLGIQYAGRQANWSVQWPHAEGYVIEVDHLPVGRLLMNRSEHLWWIVDLAILPHRRGEGIGGQVVADLVRQAGMIGARLGLRTERDNRSRRLFERHGLKVVGEDEEQVFLQTHPEAPLNAPI